MNAVRKQISSAYIKLGSIVGYKQLGAILYGREVLDTKTLFLSFSELKQYQTVYKKIRSKEEWESINQDHLSSEVLDSEMQRKISEGRKVKKVIIPGKCDVCGSNYGFFAPANINEISCRETLHCISCRCSMRARVIINHTRNLYANGKHRIYIQETGRVYEIIKNFAKDAIGSEYISSEYNSGDMINGVLHEDAHNLSFPNESLDVVVSRDVFEHINDISLCLSEAYRVLTKGGYLIFSVPWNPKVLDNHRRARINMNGKIEYIDEPVYHGNPLTGSNDSLVFWDYGWELLDELYGAGFADAYVQAYYDIKKGYLGEIGSYFVAQK